MPDNDNFYPIEDDIELRFSLVWFSQATLFLGASRLTGDGENWEFKERAPEVFEPQPTHVAELCKDK